MSVQEENLAAIADAIREKEGSAEPIPAGEFAERILALPSSSLPEGVRIINVTSSDPEMGTVSGGGVASDGMMVTVTARGVNGNLFEEWQENQNAVSKEKEYTFPVTKDRELQALFVDYQMDWVETTMPGTWEYWKSVAYGNGKFVAISKSQKAAYSTDGIEWQECTLPSLGLSTLSSIAFGNDKFVVVGGTNSTNKVVYSTDGITWEESSLPIKTTWNIVAYGGGKFVAFPSSGDKFVYSDDGITWNLGYLPSSERWVSVAYGNGKFVAIAGQYEGNHTSDKAIYSTDGVIWYDTTLSSVVGWRAVTYGDGKFVAISYHKKASYSIDGIVWENLSLDNILESFRGNAIAYGNGKFVATQSSHADAIYSTDGLTWRKASLPSSGNWISIIYGDGKFVAVNSGSTMAAYAPG